jgi:hypothetical protein
MPGKPAAGSSSVGHIKASHEGYRQLRKRERDREREIERDRER